MGRAKFLSIYLLGFLFPNAGFPRVESEQQQASSAEGIIPPPLSCLGIGFCGNFVPTLGICFLLGIVLFIPAFFSKKFCKYDYICHVFYVTIKAYKENGYGRKQSI